MPYFLALKAEAFYLADRPAKALEAIREAEALVEISGERWWCAELRRLRGVFLAATGAEEAQIEDSFSEAIRIAKEQKSVFLEKRAEGTYVDTVAKKRAGPDDNHLEAGVLRHRIEHHAGRSARGNSHRGVLSWLAAIADAAGETRRG